MEALIILIILTSGFIYTSLNPIARFKQTRSSGWVQYLHMFSKGLFFSFISYILVCIIWYIETFQQIINSYCLPLVSKDISISFIAWGCLTILLTYIFSVLLNLRSETQNKSICNYTKENPLKSLLYTASKDSKFIQVTLNSKKVYVGIVVFNNNIQDPKLEYVSIYPLRSGYRDEERLIIHFTNEYTQQYKTILTIMKYIITIRKKSQKTKNKSWKKRIKKLAEKKEKLFLNTLENFRLIIPTSNIVSASFYEPEVFDCINSKVEIILN